MVDPFHQNRWDYFYSFDRRGEEKVKRRVTVIFENDQLKEIVGNIGPGTSPIVDEGGTVITESQADDKGFLRRTWERIWPGEDE